LCYKKKSTKLDRPNNVRNNVLPKVNVRDKTNGWNMLQSCGGVLESLRLAQRYGFSKVEVHVDSKVVAKNLTSDGDVGAAGSG